MRLHRRERPWFSQSAVAGFYTPRLSPYAVGYADRPDSPPTRTPVSVDLEAEVDLAAADQILDSASLEAADLTTLLNDLMQAYGGLPLAVAQRVVERRGVDLSDIFGIATASPYFAPAKPRTPSVLRTDQVARGPSPATRGKYGNIQHRRGQSA